MSAPLLLAILFSATMLWSPCCSIHDVYIYQSNERQQAKLKILCRELVMDTEMKIKSVQHYRDQYYKSLQYQLGDIVYELRDNFKLMVRLFQRAERNVTMNNIDASENIRIFVEVRRLAVEIENKVHMVQEWQFRRATAIEQEENMKDPLRSGVSRDYDQSEELLREAAVRQRIARMRRQRLSPSPPRRTPRAPRAPVDGAKRKNQKWQYARGYEFG